MVDNCAQCVEATSVQARIFALLIETGLGSIAVGVRHAFGLATDIRITKVFRNARARSRTSFFFAHGIESARRRVAGRRHFDRLIY